MSLPSSVDRQLLEETLLGPAKTQLLEALLKWKTGLSLQQALIAHGLISPQVLEMLQTANPAEGDERSGDPTNPTLLGGSAVPVPGAGGSTDTGRYHKIRTHAKGGLGEVFVARDEELGREVALKEIQSHAADDRESRTRFVREAQVTGNLEHPGIVPVYGLGADSQGRPFYAMRLIQGEGMDRAIGKYHALKGEEKAAALRPLLNRFISVCNAIGFAHSRGVIHRDLKPANVMLGNFGETLVVDWGLARVIKEQPRECKAKEPLGEATETQQGQIMGTLAYLSPEQAAGQNDLVGPASDIYSLGVILYEVLTSKLPIDPRGGLMEVLEKVNRGDYISPRRLDRGIPRGLEAICLKAMRVTIEERYQSAGELAGDIERWLADDPVGAYRESAVERLKRWSRRNRPWVQAGMIALALVSIVSVAAVFLVNQSREEEREARQDEEAAAELANEKANEAKKERRRALKALAVSEERRAAAARLALGRGLALCAEGNSAEGMLWLARALEIAPASHQELQRTTRDALAGWSFDLSPVRLNIDSSGALDLSPDGKHLAMADKSRVIFRDPATGERLPGELDHPKKEIAELRFSPDGKILAVVAGAGFPSGVRELWLWEVGKRALLRKFPAAQTFPAGQTLFAFSPEGTTLVVASGTTAQHHDLKTGKAIGQPLTHTQPITVLDVSPDAKRLLTGTSGLKAKAAVRLWDGPSGKPLCDWIPHEGNVVCVAFSPNGKQFLTTATGKSTRPPIPAGEWQTCVRDTETRDKIGVPMVHGGVRKARFSPAGDTVLSFGWDRTTRLYNAVSGGLLWQTFGSRGTVNDARLSPDGKLVVIATEANTASLLDARTGQAYGPALLHAAAVRFARFMPDGKGLVTAGFGSLRRWSLRPGPPQGRTLKHGQPIWCVAFSPDGSRVLTGGDKNYARVWDASSGKAIGPPLTHDSEGRAVSRILAVALSPDNRTVATGGVDQTVRLWSLPDGGALRKPLLHHHLIDVLRFSHDWKRLLTGKQSDLGEKWSTKDGLPGQFWDVRTGKPLGPKQGFFGITVSDDGSRVVRLSGKTVRLWDLTTNKPLGPTISTPDPINLVLLSPDKKTVTVQTLKDIFRWNGVTGTPAASPLINTVRGQSGVFSPDGNTVLSGGASDTLSRYFPGWTKQAGESSVVAGIAWRWDFQSGLPLGPRLRHPADVTSVAFSRDGRRMLTGSLDGVARIWNVPPPIKAAPERVTLWVQVMTCLELDGIGIVGYLTPQEWQKRRGRLDSMGGSPR